MKIKQCDYCKNRYECHKPFIDYYCKYEFKKDYLEYLFLKLRLHKKYYIYKIEKDILNNTVEKLGKDNQIDIVIEELSELTKEICKYKSGLLNEMNMGEEISHALIMIYQLIAILDSEEHYMNEKVRYQNYLVKKRMELLIDKGE